uniref:WD_REPEATS_REGION domain-containing protein n=1 Tax=Macrostomum lignano TaxID=282301 RepID=A0A1I8FUF7_9PLAT
RASGHRGHGSPASPLWSSGLGRLVCAIGDSSDEAGRPATSADRVMSLAADAGFSLLASGSHSGRVRLHRPFTGQPVAELRIRSDYASVGALQFAPAAATPASCTAAATMPPCDCFGWPSTRPASGPCSWCPPPAGPAARPQRPGHRPGLRARPRHVGVRGLHRPAVDAGLRECSTVFNHHKGAVLACALAPDGSLGFTGANDASILVYDLSDKSLVHTEPQAHGDWVTSLDCFRATDSAESELRLVSGSNDFSVKLWRVQPDSHSLSQLLRLTGHVSAVSCVRGLPNCLASSCSGLWTYTEASAGGKVRAVGVEAPCTEREQRSNACLLARPPTVSAAAKSSAAAAKTSAAAAKTSAAATAAAAASSKSKKSKKKLPASPSSSSEEEDSDDGGAVKVSLDDIDFGRGGCGRGGGGGDWDAQVDEDKQRGDHAEAADRPTDRRPAEAVVVCGASDDESCGESDGVVA